LYTNFPIKLYITLVHALLFPVTLYITHFRQIVQPVRPRPACALLYILLESEWTHFIIYMVTLLSKTRTNTWMKVKPRDLLNFFLIFGGWKCKEWKVVLVAIYLLWQITLQG
jgi:hypothetical protein